MIRKGKLSRYSKDGDKKSYDNNNRGRDKNDRDMKNQPRGLVINVISKGPTTARTSSNSRKAYAQEVMSIVGEPPMRVKIVIVLTFDDSDLEGVKFPHDDP